MTAGGEAPESGPPLPGPFVHALLNQLGAILGHAELLLEELPPDSPQLADVRMIRDACRKAIALTEEWRG